MRDCRPATSGGAQRTVTLEWKAILEEYRRGGVGRKDFCAGRGIKVSTFDYWQNRLRKVGSKPAEVVKITEVPAPRAAAIRIHLGEKIVIELDGELCEEDLEMVLRVAGRV